MLLDVALIAVFLLVGGFFAAAEIALVTLRDGQARALAECGRRGRRVARLRADSNRFLSSVQVGVTVAGFFASSYGATTIAARLDPVLAGWGMPVALASTVALVGVTLVVSYLSLVVSELVPKRVALQHPERTALATAGVLDRVATVFRPVIWVLSRSTDAVARLLGVGAPTGGGRVSEEELRDMVRTSSSMGAEERRLLSNAFGATDRVLREVMVPRTEVDFLDGVLSPQQAAARVLDRPHSRYPVLGDDVDDVVGVLHVRDLLGAAYGDGARSVTELARPVTVLPGTKNVLDALGHLRRGGGHLAVVIDEYGGNDGIVTIEDLVEEIVGDIRGESDDLAGPVARPLPGGGYDADGLVSAAALQEQTGIGLPDGPYDTLGGFVLARLGRAPAGGDAVAAAGYRFTVGEVDGHRVARVRIAPEPGSERGADGHDGGGNSDGDNGGGPPT